jgi:hypothetical protein
MSKFFSCLATKNKLIAFYGVDNHTTLIEMAGLKDNSATPTFVGLEFTPDNPMTLDFTKWSFRVDQDILPDWFVTEEWHQRCIEFLENVHSIRESQKYGHGHIWFCDSELDVLLPYSSILFMLGSSNVGEMLGSSNVGEMLGSSNVGVMWGSSKVGVMRGSSNVGVMWGSSKVGEMWGSSNVGKDNRG